MQVSIARQLGLQPTTVGNFFMNARRRLHDKWQSSNLNNEHEITSTNNEITSTHLNNTGAKLENNNDSNMAACIMVDYPTHHSAIAVANNHETPHDLEGFSLDSFEPVTSEATAASCVYSLTSL